MDLTPCSAGWLHSAVLVWVLAAAEGEGSPCKAFQELSQTTRFLPQADLQTLPGSPLLQHILAAAGGAGTALLELCGEEGRGVRQDPSSEGSPGAPCSLWFALTTQALVAL